MENKKLIALIVLGIAAVISLYYGMSSGSKYGRPAKNTDTTAPRYVVQKEDPKPQEAQSIRRRAKKSPYATWARSPFMPKSAKGSSYQMELSGIIGSSPNLKAMINGEVVGKGGRVGSCTVTDVFSDRVTLNDGTKDIVLKLEQ